MSTFTKIARALLFAGLAALALLSIAIIGFLAWLNSLDLDAGGFQFG